MRLQQHLSALLLATAAFLVAACNNGEQKSSSAADSINTTSANATTSAPPSSAGPSQQNLLVIKHKVADFAKWKMAYDAHDSARLAAGIHSYVIGRGLQDSNMVLVSLKVDDTTKAMAFGKDPGLKAAMQKGGVIGTPVVSLVNMTLLDQAVIPSKLRSSVMLTVKDWDTWLKNFQEGEQERTANGIVARAYGHDANDNHKVRVVTALVDSAKATTYYKSDMLKKRMETSGVVGSPDRFLYRIVQRY